VSKTVSSSKILNESQFSVPKADDRFKTGAMPKCNRWNTPGAGSYHPADSLNQNFNSNYKFQGSCSIGKDKKTFLDLEWGNK
jgi:hypothetical protein